MDLWWWILLVLLAGVVLVYSSSTAGRLDRLHRRVEIGAANLAAALASRRELADHTASTGLLDPASSMLIADAVQHVVDAPSGDKVAIELAESDLTGVLCAVFADAGEVDVIVAEPGGDMVVRLADSCRRVQIGRRFYNDAVHSTRTMRSRRLVRLLRLAGTAPMPESVEMVDTVPPGFVGR